MSGSTAHVCNLPESAGALYKHSVDAPLHFKVKALLASLECKRVLVACSGGADSVFMLCQLWAQKEELGVQLVVAHYNHRWRGEDSEKDARFVEAMSRQLGCSFVMDTRPEDKLALTETSARALRIDFLRATASVQNCQCIALGHQQDDILETQLQRLGRGSGASGLAAPRPVHYFDAYPTHIRPLLQLNAHTIREALREHSMPWCEDVSNNAIEITRNALRHVVIPKLRAALEHDVDKGAARSRELLEEDALALDQFATILLSDASHENKALKRFVLKAAPRAITRRVLNSWLGTHCLGASLNAAAINRLIDVIYGNRERFQLSAGGRFIEVDTAWIRIESADASMLSLDPCSVKAGESVVLSTGALLETEFVPIDEELRRQLSNGSIDADREAYLAVVPEQILQIRSRQPGNTFRPIGSPGRRKLKNWFIDRKIPVRERNLLPLVIIPPRGIAWVPSLPPADDLKINATMNMALKLTYKASKTTFTD